MMNISFAALLPVTILLWNSAASAVNDAQVVLDVSAESVARIALYYENKPIEGGSFDFSLPVNGISQKFERESGFFHIVGNIDQADIVFAETNFTLPQISGGNSIINLNGEFIFRAQAFQALQTLRVPVIRNTGQSNVQNGVKIHFSSEKLAGDYTKGQYANTFTLLLTPVI
ncbi:hypothetical protein [Duffyella gerundensis]|uniref:hypothetical protein n=1 Tax=Duffyella gerundensis TaxID=1619313 RepID=UPI0021F76E6D|nr:hypothetical protein [Duffyella gerundensis]